MIIDAVKAGGSPLPRVVVLTIAWRLGFPVSEKAMQFGIFGGAQADSTRPGAAMGQGFHDFIDFNVEAEALGYRSTFIVEHHFTGWNQVSAPLTLLTWLAARTRTLRLGTAVMVLPWHNPVILAEQAATLDLMSDGRLDFDDDLLAEPQTILAHAS